MIIVSQDKCEITTDINIYIEESWRGFCIKNLANGILGVYETEERAKEVIQNIIIAINSSSKIFEMPEE